jgi:hypothetical protein
VMRWTPVFNVFTGRCGRFAGRLPRASGALGAC